jgi:hypothetical protein
MSAPPTIVSGARGRRRAEASVLDRVRERHEAAAARWRELAASANASPRRRLNRFGGAPGDERDTGRGGASMHRLDLPAGSTIVFAATA